jgi:hypothetical protein
MLMLAGVAGLRNMSEEHFAVSRIAPAPEAQSDYDSICAALMQTERGRWFLEEYAKRNRSADTHLLLAAIQRIEAVVCTERSKQAQQGFRSDLLEMAKAITRTREEVAEIRSDGAHRPEPAHPDGEASLPPQSRDVFATAERIRDVTWAMRGHGFDPTTCDQLEELAGSILSATSLRDPTDHRASKLSEVLRYLEHRIETLLESSHDGEASPQAASAPEPAVGPEPAFGPEPGGEAGPATAFASTLVAAQSEPGAADLEAGPSSPASPQTDFPGTLSAAHDDLDGGTAESSPPAVEIAPQEPPEPELSPDLSVAPAIELTDPAPAAHDDIPAPTSHLATADTEPPNEGAESQLSSPIDHMAGDAPSEPPPPVEIQEASLPPPPDPPAGSAIELRGPSDLPSPDAEPNLPRSEAAPEPAISAPARETAAGTEAQSRPSIDSPAAGAPPQGDLLPSVELSGPIPFMSRSPDTQPLAAAPRAAHSFLPEIHMGSDMPGLGAVRAQRVPPAASAPHAFAAPPEPAPPEIDLAADLDGGRPTPGGSDTAAMVLPSAASPHPAAAADMPALPIEMTSVEAAETLATPPLAAPAQAAAEPQAPRVDPLAALNAMSDGELIALFS